MLRPALACLTVALTAAPAQAGLLDSLFGGAAAEPSRSATNQRVWVVREFSEVRIVPREAGAAPNQHPAQINPEVLRQQLAQVRYAAGNVTRPLFVAAEVAELVEPIAEALASAGPSDDVLLLSSARRGDAVMFRPVAVTARLFVHSGSLQLIVNDARYEFFDNMRGTQKEPQFTYGSRTRTGTAVLSADAAKAVRADWLAIPLTASAAAPAAAVPGAVLPAPVAAPAPAAAPPSPSAAGVPPPRPRDPGFADEIEQRLITLKRLRDRGLISEEEYQQKRREILQLL